MVTSQDAEYLRKLMEVWSDCEEMEDVKSLATMARLFKSISKSDNTT